MKDIYGNKQPICIEVDEWWFNGRIIQKQNHPILPEYISFADNGEPFTSHHSTKKEAVDFALNNPCKKPKNFPKDYIGLN